MEKTIYDFRAYSIIDKSKELFLKIIYKNKKKMLSKKKYLEKNGYHVEIREKIIKKTPLI